MIDATPAEKRARHRAAHAAAEQAQARVTPTHLAAAASRALEPDGEVARAFLRGWITLASLGGEPEACGAETTGAGPCRAGVYNPPKPHPFLRAGYLPNDFFPLRPTLDADPAHPEWIPIERAIADVQTFLGSKEATEPLRPERLLSLIAAIHLSRRAESEKNKLAETDKKFLAWSTALVKHLAGARAVAGWPLPGALAGLSRDAADALVRTLLVIQYSHTNLEERTFLVELKVLDPLPEYVPTGAREAWLARPVLPVENLVAQGTLETLLVP